MKSFALLAVLPVLALAAKHDRPARVHTQVGRDLDTRASQYKLVKKYQGQSFLE
jgi:hypothetical protein